MMGNNPVEYVQKIRMFLLLSRIIIVKRCNLTIYTHTYTHVHIYVNELSQGISKKKDMLQSGRKAGFELCKLIELIIYLFVFIINIYILLVLYLKKQTNQNYAS